MEDKDFWDFENKIFEEVRKTTEKECKEEYKKLLPK